MRKSAGLARVWWLTTHENPEKPRKTGHFGTKTQETCGKSGNFA
jgi:hypothetical protein